MGSREAGGDPLKLSLGVLAQFLPLASPSLPSPPPLLLLPPQSLLPFPSDLAVPHLVLSPLFRPLSRAGLPPPPRIPGLRCPVWWPGARAAREVPATPGPGRAAAPDSARQPMTSPRFASLIGCLWLVAGDSGRFAWRVPLSLRLFRRRRGRRPRGLCAALVRRVQGPPAGKRGGDSGPGGFVPGRAGSRVRETQRAGGGAGGTPRAAHPIRQVAASSPARPRLHWEGPRLESNRALGLGSGISFPVCVLRLV